MYIEFLTNKKYPGKQAVVSDSPEMFQNAGYLLSEHEVVVDIDNLDKETIKKLIKLFDINTQIVWTTRGAHLYFKKPQGFKGSTRVCPLGFPVEYKHHKNTKHITIKQNGKMREIENEGVREDLPDVLFTHKRLDSLLGMDDQDGRNNALFAHRMKIQHLPNWSSVLRFINDNIFATPLDEDELQTISRDVKMNVMSSSEPEVANYILSNYSMVLYNGDLYWYEEGSYRSDEDQLKRLVINEVGLKKTSYIDEVIKQMRYRAKIVELDKVFDIKLKNGILREGKFVQIDYKDFTPFFIDIPYDPKAPTVKIVDDYVNHLTNEDEDYRNLLFEILAHCLIVNKDFKRMLAKFFIFVGDGGNGKGTLLLIIRKILGYKNCSALSIKNMTDERYFTTTQGKLVNLGDDVQDEAIDNEQMKILKNISTCDFVATRNLFEQSRDIELTLSLIFTSNHILKSFEKGEAYRRRVQWLPIYNKPKVKDKNFISKITTPEALKYWMKLIIEGYERLYRQEGFTESESVRRFNEEYHTENNNILQYLDDFTAEDFVDLRSPDAHGDYEVWAEENGLNVQSRKLFVQSVYEKFGLELKQKKINGKNARVFQK